MKIGTHLAHYRITAKLGEGGMGEVYRAEDTRLQRDVAIKVLPADLADDPDRLARLEREARVLARLDHPNIAPIYGLEEATPAAGAGTVRFLVMQLADGETLEELLDRRGGASRTVVSPDATTAAPVAGDASTTSGDEGRRGSGGESRAGVDGERRRGLPLDEALSIASAVADALEAAHDAGIVHRDLKPANVKVAFKDDVPVVKVLDFGLAKFYQGDPDEEDSLDASASPTMMAATKAGLIMGTAGYMSPEQARGQPVDRRADLWAFGAVLYEMLTGRRAFVGQTVSDTLAAVLKDEVDFGALPETTPLPLRRLLRRCLQRDRRRRLRDIADARLEIEAAAAGMLGDDTDDLRELADRVGLAGVGAPSDLDRPTGATTTWKRGLAALALVAIGATGTWLAVPSAAPTAREVRMFGDLGPSAARSAVISPDGAKLALDIGDGVWARDFDDLTPLFIEGSAGIRGRPFWSPDSTHVAFFVNGELYVGSAADGSSRRVPYEGGRLATVRGAWGADGIIVATGRDLGELVMISPATGEARTVARSPRPGILRYPLLMPDGATLVYEFSERGGATRSYGVAMVQRGLDPDAEVETILELDDEIVGFEYDESIEQLLIEGRDTGIWSMPLTRAGVRPPGPLDRLFRDGEDMSLSRDGTLVYRALLARLESQPFRWIDRGGEVAETIESGRTGQRALALDPDGTRVAFTLRPEGSDAADSETWIRDLARGADTRIDFEGTLLGTNVAWLGNDSVGVFAVAPEGGTSLLRMPASGAGRPEVIADGGVFRSLGASRDGRYVVFSALTRDGVLVDPSATDAPVLGPGGRLGRPRPPGANENDRQGAASRAGTRSGGEQRARSQLWNLYYVVEGDDTVARYRDVDDNETQPALSPDAARIAFISDASGSTEAWVDTFPEPSEQVRISINGAVHVLWSPSGDEILFSDGAGVLWSVPVAAGAAHGRDAYLVPVRLFEQGDVATGFSSAGLRTWDVSPDGQRVLTVQRWAQGISPVNVIQNFPRWFLESRPQ